MDPVIRNLFRSIQLRCADELLPGDIVLTETAIQMEKEKIWDKIRQTDTSKLEPGLNETELIQQLVSIQSFCVKWVLC
jgi:hypothetical protein